MTRWLDLHRDEVIELLDVRGALDGIAAQSTVDRFDDTEVTGRAFWRARRVHARNAQRGAMRLFVSAQWAAVFITHSITEAVYLSTRVLVMSARPGRIVAELNVPFPYPRSPDLRFHPDFARLAGKVSHALREGA